MSVDKFGRHGRSSGGEIHTHSNDLKSFHDQSTGDYDFENKRLKNVANPVDFQDAVNRRYFESKVPVQLAKAYSFRQFGIKDVGYPRDNGDAVTLQYLKTNCVLVDQEQQQQGTIDARSMRITNLDEPTDGNDAVTLDYVLNNAICTSINMSHAFDARFHRIEKLSKPQDLDDAVSKRYLKEAMADLAYTVYLKLLRSKASPRTTAIKKDLWDLLVDQGSTWEELFKSI